MDNQFFEWAEANGITVMREHYLCWKRGKEEGQQTINILSGEVLRLKDIIRERNHEMGMG